MAHDADDAAGVAACFAEEGLMAVWLRGSRPEEVGTIQGRRAIEEQTRHSLARKDCPRRHLLGTMVVEDGPEGCVTATTYFQVWELPAGARAELVTTGTYTDTVVLGDTPLLRRRGIELDAPAFRT